MYFCSTSRSISSVAVEFEIPSRRATSLEVADFFISKSHKTLICAIVIEPEKGFLAGMEKNRARTD